MPDEFKPFAEVLKNGGVVILDLSNLETELTNPIIEFFSGICYVKGGGQKKLSTQPIFIFWTLPFTLTDQPPLTIR